MRLLLAVVLITCAELSLASLPLTDEVRDELKDSLYPIESIIPGYQRPPQAVPRLAVAEFRINSQHLHELSQVISEILRFRIHYIPTVRLYMASTYITLTDAQIDDGPDRPLLTAHQHFQNLHRSLGIETILTGSIEENESGFTLVTELVDASSAEINSQKKWQFKSHELPAVLIQIVEWTYLSLGVGLSDVERDYIADKNTLKNDAIEAFKQHYSDFPGMDAPLKRDLLDRLQKQHPEFALLTASVLSNRAYAQNHEEAYENIEVYDRLRAAHPANAGIALQTFIALDINVMPKHEVATRLKKMKRLIQENPHDPVMMINLATALIDNGNSIDAIAISLETIERWPDNYRAWWNLGWVVNRHAWQVRGNTFWRDVPEKAKGIFQSLTPLADDLIDRALKINQHNPRLWNMKIKSLAGVDGYSDQLLEVFDKAVAAGPRYEPIYNNALNFSTDKWGGNAKARRHIIETAEKHNPDASWPKRMRHQHSADFEIPDFSKSINKLERYYWDYYEHPYFWKGVLLVAMALLWIIYAVGKWAGRREVVSDADMARQYRQSDSSSRGDRRKRG